MTLSNITSFQRLREQTFVRDSVKFLVSGSILFHLTLLGAAAVYSLRQTETLVESPLELTFIEQEPKEEPLEESVLSYEGGSSADSVNLLKTVRPRREENPLVPNLPEPEPVVSDPVPEPPEDPIVPQLPLPQAVTPSPTDIPTQPTAASPTDAPASASPQSSGESSAPAADVSGGNGGQGIGNGVGDGIGDGAGEGDVGVTATTPDDVLVPPTQSPPLVSKVITPSSPPPPPTTSKTRSEGTYKQERGEVLLHGFSTQVKLVFNQGKLVDVQPTIPIPDALLRQAFEGKKRDIIRSFNKLPRDVRAKREAVGYMPVRFNDPNPKYASKQEVDAAFRRNQQIMRQMRASQNQGGDAANVNSPSPVTSINLPESGASDAPSSPVPRKRVPVEEISPAVTTRPTLPEPPTSLPSQPEAVSEPDSVTPVAPSEVPITPLAPSSATAPTVTPSAPPPSTTPPATPSTPLPSISPSTPPSPASSPADADPVDVDTETDATPSDRLPVEESPSETTTQIQSPLGAPSL